MEEGLYGDPENEERIIVEGKWKIWHLTRRGGWETICMGNEKTLLAFSKAQLPGNKRWWRLRAWLRTHMVGDERHPEGSVLGALCCPTWKRSVRGAHSQQEGPWSLRAGTPALPLPKLFTSPPLLPSLGGFCFLSWQQSILLLFFSEQAWRVFILYPNIKESDLT